MLKPTTWTNAIKRGGACHGPTGSSIELNGIGADINSITVDKDHKGAYSILLEVIFEFGNGLTKEQVMTKLKELSALDSEWE